MKRLSKSIKRAQEFDEVEEKELRNEYLEQLRDSEPSESERVIPLPTNDKTKKESPKPNSVGYGLNIRSRNQNQHDSEKTLRSVNRIPGLTATMTEKQKYQADINDRPKENDLESYYRVPVEDFGAALLRGMGWSAGNPIGKNPNGITEPIKLESRPDLLGLGAQPPPDFDGNKKKGTTLTSNDKVNDKKRRRDDEMPPPRSDFNNPTVDISVGSYVQVISGSKQGESGKIHEIKTREGGTALKIYSEQRRDLISVWADQVKPKKLEKYWLRPNIQARIISKRLGEGKFYNMRCRIKDVPVRGSCTIESKTGIVFDNVEQDWLETVIPRNGKTVMIVWHTDKSLIGQLGELLECDDTKHIGIIRLDSSYEMMQIPFDDFSEYQDNLH